MELGLLTDSVSSMTRDQALDTAVELGLSTVELGLGGAHGGWSPAPHADLRDLLENHGARRRLLNDVEVRGLRLEAFNAAGNPLHPVEGGRDDAVVRGAVRLAGELGVPTVVLMSGLPGAPGDSFPAWITTVWPPENLTLLRHQWSVAVPYWADLAAEAQRSGVRLALEMHANQLVFNVSSLLRLRAELGDDLASVVGANLDPSHLWWMGADPCAAAGALSGAVYHVHAKDTRLEPLAQITSRLEPVANEEIERRAWNYVAVGRGHDTAWWSDFLAAVHVAGYDGPVSIENEDYELGQRDSVALATQTLAAALAAPGATPDAEATLV